MKFANSVPLEGHWTVTGSDRSYDWIGPKSTIPFLGQLFSSFDRLIPFTKMIRLLRKLFGSGTDSLDGRYSIKVIKCGAQLEVMGRLFTRTQDYYENTTDAAGTIHTMRLSMDSSKAMTGQFSFSIGDQTSRIPAKEIAKLKQAGIDINTFKNIHMESDKPMQWRYAGTAEE